MILPRMKSDEEAESLLDENLSEYLTPENFSANFTPTAFEFVSGNTSIELQLSPGLLDAVKLIAARRGIDVQKFIQDSIERAIEVESRQGELA